MGRQAQTAALLALALGAAGCTQLFFHPDAVVRATPDAVGIAYAETPLALGGDSEVYTWFLPADDGVERPAQGCTIVHLHGNGGNVGAFLPAVAWLPTEGVNVLMIEYPGYGAYSGRPQIDVIHRDAAAALEVVTSDSPPIDSIDPDRVVVFGQSLGGAVSIVALTQARTQRVRALATEGAFSGYRRIARDKLGSAWLTWPLQVPLSWTVTNRYRPLEAIEQVDGRPVLIIHSDNDPIVPQSHGRRLFDAASEPKELWSPSTGHVGALLSEEWRNAFLEWLDGVCAPAPPVPSNAPVDASVALE